MSYYKIINVVSSDDEILWWSNEQGWVDYDSSDTFTEIEKWQLNLPIEGKWVSILAPKKKRRILE